MLQFTETGLITGSRGNGNKDGGLKACLPLSDTFLHTVGVLLLQSLELVSLLLALCGQLFSVLQA